MKISLKSQNLPLITFYVVFNIAIFLTLYEKGSIDINSIKSYLVEFQIKDGVFFGLMNLVVILIGGLFSNKVKEIIVFWKLSDCILPGCEAFSKFIYEDNRINIENIKNKIEKFPSIPKEQNSKWYELFKEIDDIAINKTNKEWLLCRELSVISVGLLLLSIFVIIEHKTIGCYYLLFVIGEYLAFRFCAKHMAERLVVNTLAFISASKK